jgi:RNA polymerase sigma-70 factor (ECF subfamily)
MRYGEQAVSIRWDDMALASGARLPLSSEGGPDDAQPPAAARPLQAVALERARAGDREAFRSLMLAHQSQVYTLAVRMLTSREDAQELTQDVFLSLHRSLASIVSAAHLRHWLRRTVCHRAIDRLRRRSSMQMLPLESAEMIEDAAARDPDPSTARWLRGLIEQLQPMAKAVVLLRYQEDLDPTEIAQVLGVPVNTIKSHLRRSLSWMRRRHGQLHLIADGGADD